MRLLSQSSPKFSTTDPNGRPVDRPACIEQVQQGNEHAMETLFRTYYADLVAFAEVQIQDRAAAEDLVEDIFLKIWEKGPGWQIEGALRPYLYGAVRKQCLMYFRRRRTRARFHTDEDAERCTGGRKPEEDFRSKELHLLADEAVAALPERRREIFMLSRHHGLTYAEIAGVLDLSVNTVRNQMTRALQFLHERLGPYLFETLLLLAALSVW